jgi:Reverse transcriptase-like
MSGGSSYGERYAHKPLLTDLRASLGKRRSKEMSDSAVGAQGAISQTPRPRPGLYTLHTDGGIVAAAGQAGGEAAIGTVLKNSDNLLVEAISESIGHVDVHNVAEFRALLEGLTMAKRHNVDKIDLLSVLMGEGLAPLGPPSLSG